MPYHVVWEIQVMQITPGLLPSLITCPDVMHVEKVDDQRIRVMLVEGRAHADIEGWEDLIMEPSGYEIWQVDGGYRGRIADEQMSTSAFNRIAYPEDSHEGFQEILESSGLFPSPSQHSSVDTRIPCENLDPPLMVGGPAQTGGQTVGVISAIDTSYVGGADVEQTANVQLFLQNHRRIMQVPVSMIDVQPNDAHLQIGAYITLAEEAAEAILIAVVGEYAEITIRDVQPQPSQLFQYWRARTEHPAGEVDPRISAAQATLALRADLRVMHGIDYGDGEDTPAVATVDREAGKSIDPPTIYDRMLDDSDD